MQHLSNNPIVGGEGPALHFSNKGIKPVVKYLNDSFNPRVKTGNELVNMYVGNTKETPMYNFINSGNRK